MHASALVAAAVARLAERRGCGSIVDLGAGGGELLCRLDRIVGPDVSLTGVDLAPRPEALPARVSWSAQLPDRVDGLVVANEWLDNIPCDVIEVDRHGVPRVVHVDPGTGREVLGAVADDTWLARWWPLREPGARAEDGSARDEAWDGVVRRLDRGLAVAVDYGHTVDTRPVAGSIASYRRGRQVDVVPDGTRDVTAHVAVDSLGGHVTRQRDALRDLGVHGTRPPLELAREDPTRYLHDLVRASEAAEVTARGGLGDFFWVTATAP